MTEYRTLWQFTPPNLIAGDFPIVTQTITVGKGQSLPAGAVLGRQSSGNYVLSNTAANDGSENPIVVLAQAVDATNSETECVCYLSGQFNAKALTLGDGHTFGSIAHFLRILNIYITNTL